MLRQTLRLTGEHNALWLKFKLPRRCNHSQNKGATTSFGFTDVLIEERQSKGLFTCYAFTKAVNHVFNKVSEKYDLMNDIMSAGVHRIWKNHFVEKIRPTADLMYLDVAAGTGDIALRILQRVEHKMSADKPVITICDINSNMMEAGKQRSDLQSYLNQIIWKEGNAEELPFPDKCFDVYTIAFGIRNCTHIDKVLREAHRVLKPYGRFYCLEFSAVNNPLLKNVYDSYSMQVIPVLGQLIAGDWNSYQYLVESIRNFPDQATFAHMIQTAGFKKVTWDNYSGGIAAAHFGLKFPAR